MTMWEGVDLAEHWFVWEHQSLSIGMGDTSPVLIVTLNCLGEWKSLVWSKQGFGTSVTVLLDAG